MNAPGFRFDDACLEVLWEGADRRFCKLRHDDAKGDQYAYIAGSAGSGHESRAAITRLAHEYELKSSLDEAWALQPLELLHEGGRTILLVQYSTGAPLDQFMDHRMATGPFLRLAIELAGALGLLHGKGLIHKDLKPANIVVDPVAAKIWLTGFGIAAHVPNRRALKVTPETITGTLAYMAPEQTGRMDCAIDARSDLYALGVTLYQMITGVLPFAAEDPMELVHSHIARQAVPPAERTEGVPAAVSAIIMKLLSKTPEDRYQTAAGLHADLRHCLALYQLTADFGPFVLSSHDIPDLLRIPDTLYGREDSVLALFAAFERVASGGSSELMLVSGYSGIGKSSVVNKLQKTLHTSQGIFAAGKCDPFKQDIPYAALAQALGDLVHMILRASEPELAHWRDAIQGALNPNGQLITSLIPELELVIGKQCPVPDLPPQDSGNRFQMVFRNFLQVFARPEHPLILFLDDLQSIDEATLALVEELIGQREIGHLLLIGAYRDNEVGSSHPLVAAFDAMRRTGTPVREIKLATLAPGDLGRLIAGALHCDEQSAYPLMCLINEKTGGNPYFTIEFLSELTIESLLHFDAGTAAWTWDAPRIAAKGYADNIVHLMVGKVKRLPVAAQQSLKQLACLGNIAQFATLAIVRKCPEEQIHTAFEDAAKAGLIVRLGAAYQFSHDRVQEAAYALIPPALRADAHLRIGRHLLAAGVAEPTAEWIFAVVNQLNYAVDLISDVNEKNTLRELNISAGLRAKAGIAYGAARDYLAQAAALTATDSWAQANAATLELHLLLAESEYLVGNFAAADQLFKLMLDNACSDLDRARIYSLRMKVYQVGNSYNQSFEFALEALRLFGVGFPESDEAIQTAADAEFRAVRENLRGRQIGELLDAPTADSPEVRAIIDLLVDAVPSAYNGRPKLFPLVVMRAVNYSLQFGHTDQSSYAYAVHALMLVGVYGEMAQAFEFSEMALRLNEKFKNVRLRGTLLHLHGDHVNFWRRPFATGIPILEQGFRACLEVGDLVYAGHLAFLSVWQAIERGDEIGAVSMLAADNSKFARQSHNDAVRETIELELQFLACLQGRTSAPLMFDAAGFDECCSLAILERAAFGCGLAFHPIMKQMLAVVFGRHSEALIFARQAEPMLAAAMATPIEASHHFYYALTVTALYPEAPLQERQQFTSIVKDKLKRLKHWAENCPENFQDRYALVRAEVARIENRPDEATEWYEKAIRSARDNGFVHIEALASELAAQFYAARGFETIAHAYLREARYCYHRWGAQGKVEQLDQYYPHIRSDHRRAEPATTVQVQIEHLDLATVIKVSEAVSGEIVLEKLIDTLMRIAIEHAGAQRGLLIVPRGDEYRIEAEVTIRADAVDVDLRQTSVTAADLPESVFHYVVRTRENLVLGDASGLSPYAADDYIFARRSRSVLCMPILKQGTMLGLLYLENSLMPHAFTPARMAVLKLLASAAASSMENARLYRDLAVREARIRRLVDANIIGIVISDTAGRILEANDAFLRIVGYDREDLVSQRVRWTDMTPPEWRERDKQYLVPQLKMAGSLQPFEKEFFRKDGSRVPVLIGVASFETGGDQGVAFVLDLTERKQAVEALRALQMDLAHANRLATMGQLAASIAHEVNQAIGASRNNSHAALRFLSSDPPDIGDAIEALECVVGDTYRAGEIIGRIRDQVRKVPAHMEQVALNDAIKEVISLVRGEMSKHQVTVRMQLAEAVQSVRGDRVQLQQVMLNLIVNAIEAMASANAALRTLTIVTEAVSSHDLLVTVSDTGPGIATENRERAFESLYTTKAGGLGIGLSICRSIIDAHGGKLWMDPALPHGAAFRFTLPPLQ
ncbi:AAA family ATPase [Massilia sp. RP-1-19]|uniref:histidine kinase n=1 Tax=Massilia polaris TaxID=2728846 RepID=A0A848HIT6_9BURK|nr:AAA family ATPase [Massilia polaris]NML60992.1 AAA family ATPase [Massilia polaris]